MHNNGINEYVLYKVIQVSTNVSRFENGWLGTVLADPIQHADFSLCLDREKLNDARELCDELAMCYGFKHGVFSPANPHDAMLTGIQDSNFLSSGMQWNH